MQERAAAATIPPWTTRDVGRRTFVKVFVSYGTQPEAQVLGVIHTDLRIHACVDVVDAGRYGTLRRADVRASASTSRGSEEERKLTLRACEAREKSPALPSPDADTCGACTPRLARVQPGPLDLVQEITCGHARSRIAAAGVKTVLTYMANGTPGPLWQSRFSRVARQMTSVVRTHLELCALGPWPSKTDCTLSYRRRCHKRP